MDSPIPSHSLCRIDECPDLMADACISDESGQLVFLSVWARDTAIQQFIARLTLGSKEDGLDQFHLINHHHASIPVFVGNVDGLAKRMTRAYRRTLFGSMAHLWLYDARCITPDKANARALALILKDSPSTESRLWRLVKDTSPLPLLDHWQEPVMTLMKQESMLCRLPLCIGPVEAHRLMIDVPLLTDKLGQMIREGTLGISPSPCLADVCLA